ncbi:MAG: response regulator transcription factor [Lachnospiraceae bacterium]
MMKILLVEDDDTIAFGIRSALKKKGYEVISCMDMAEGRRLFSGEISLILLDLNLPDGSGYEFCGWVKERGDTPVIFLTVRDDAADITKGLDMGADDYITKPFSIPVLESRIRAVLRRISKTEEGILSCGTIRIDKKRMQASARGEDISLTSLEYRLLLILIENKGCILPRNLILEKLWDDEANFVNDNTLTVAIKRLREKLKDASCIKTIRGIGYRMEDA